MRRLKRKLCGYLIGALCLVNIPFTGMIIAAADEPSGQPDMFYDATASEYGNIPKYYTESSSSRYSFVDRNGETQYRIFGSMEETASPSWYEADDEYEPAIDARIIDCAEEYITLAPIEYMIIPESEYAEDIWQSFFAKSENNIYVVDKAGEKSFRDEYSVTYLSDFSAQKTGYDSHYDPFGAFQLNGIGNEPIEYIAYGKALNDGSNTAECGWIVFDNEDAWRYTVKFISSADGKDIYGYADGIRGATSEKKVVPKGIDGYTSPKEYVLQSNDENVVFEYTPVIYSIVNYVYADGTSAADYSTDFEYDESEKGLDNKSTHVGYELKAYQFSKAAH